MEELTVKQLFDIKKGKKVEQINSGGPNKIRFIQIDDLRSNNKIKYCNKEEKYVYATKDDLIIAWDGANAGTIGYNLEGAIGSTLAVLKKKREDFNSTYVAKFLQSKAKFLRDNCTGATIPHISRSVLESIKIPIPSIETQDSIVNLLNKAQSIIEKRQAQLEALPIIAQSIFLEMFGDPANNTKGFDEIPLVNACKNKDDIRCGPFGTQLQKSEFLQSGVPLWGIKHINKQFSTPTYEFVSFEKASLLKNYNLISGDIVMTRKGTVGKCAIYPLELSEGIMHSDLLRIRVDQNIINPTFLTYQFMLNKNIEHQLSQISSGAIMKGLNVTKLKEVKVLVPQINLQNEFAAKVNKIDTIIRMNQHSLGYSIENYNSLLQLAFKGELFPAQSFINI